MKDVLQTADEIPVTLLVALAYVTLSFLTGFASPELEKLLAYGALSAQLVATGEPWRLLLHAFLHGGLVHLAFNTYMLLSIGPALERSLGSVRFAVLYVVAALGGALVVCLTNHPLQLVVGGSGALFGMLGALVAANMHAGRHLFAFLDFEGPRRLLFLIGANLVLGMLIPFISNAAHIGGLIAGFTVAFLWLFRPRTPLARHGAWRAASLALLLGLVLHALLPVTRPDYLWFGSLDQPPERRAAMQRAAAMARFGLDAANDRDVALLEALYESDD